MTKFIDGGGYFPNSLIINFNKRKKIQFEADRQGEDTDSRVGILKIPNEYAIAYIIDGQHRLYGYANSKFLSTNTVPVVAMNGLEAMEQLEIFMDINQNQKAVSPSLRLVLEEDLFWNAPRLDSRLKALRSSIVKELSVGSGPLQNKISVGEDKAELTFKPFYTALSNCGLLPKAKGNEYILDTQDASLYDTNSHDNDKTMRICKKDIVRFVNTAYEYIEDNYPSMYNNEKFIISNRGTYAFIMWLGSLHTFIYKKGLITKKISTKARFEEIKKYIVVLMDGLQVMKSEDKEHYLIMKGAGGDTAWFRLYQSIINDKFGEYNPDDLIDWKERQDKKLQTKAKEYVDSIEKTIKQTVVAQLEELYADDWELEIVNIQTKCQKLAAEENAERRKNGISKRANWTEMLTIMDYKNIIENHWTNKVSVDTAFVTFEKRFGIDIGEGFNSKKDKTKWLTYLNDYRKTIAHSGTKDEGLNEKEVSLLERIYKVLYK
ncbi:MAG: DGQHR domain-containing protein [Sulfurovum sp.]|nr:DGQHR domain-containing protein [Sulfurovum sp.]